LLRKKNGKDDQHYYTTNIHYDLNGGNEFNLQPEIQTGNTYQ
jgi:hypothetical protein